MNVAFVVLYATN